MDFRPLSSWIRKNSGTAERTEFLRIQLPAEHRNEKRSMMTTHSNADKQPGGVPTRTTCRSITFVCVGPVVSRPPV